jgi:ferric-dicitrate binding protein FerR (iron transport regulator)
VATLAAACAAFATVAVWWSHRPEVATAIVASMDRTVGVVQLRLAGHENWSPLTPADAPLTIGRGLRTDAAGRAALSFLGGISVRLDHATEIELLSPQALRLVAGRVYVDTGAHASESVFSVVTAGGTVRDVGTRFEVQFGAGTYRIRVREGRIVARQPGRAAVDGTAGDELLSLAGAPFARSMIDAHDRDWGWIESVAVAPPTDGQPISVVLDWVARETSRAVRFESPELERRATQAVLHGSIRDLAPLEALRVTLASLDLEYTVMEDGALLIRSRESAP